MQVEIITIGDELLIGQVIDTNSAWMAERLNEAGMQVHQITSVSDSRKHILESLHDSASRAGVILMTGGLGPTNDDITKNTLCEYFNVKLKFDEEMYKNLEHFFGIRGKQVTDINRKQAEVPENCIPLRNKNGTAPGMWFEEKGKIYVSLPGVPHEMKALMEEEVIPLLKKKFQLPVILHRNVLTTGIGESALAEKIAAWESSLAQEGISLAYLPGVAMVRLRLSIKGDDETILKEKVEKNIEELKKVAGKYIYGYDGDTLEGIIGKLLKTQNQTIATAESCTGGTIAHLITSVSGSSGYYKGSIIAYSNEIKMLELGVSEEILKTKGAVSQEVVEQMALAVRKKFSTDYSIAVSGIAGPAGGTPDKPVGAVWIAIAAPGAKVNSKKFLFGDNRLRNIQITAVTALNMLRKEVVRMSGEL